MNGKFIVKSGTDFRTLSAIDLVFGGDAAAAAPAAPGVAAAAAGAGAGPASNQKVEVVIREVRVNSADFDEDPELKQELDKYSQVIDSKMDLVLGQFSCDLDGGSSCLAVSLERSTSLVSSLACAGRFASIRTQETNLGNFVCDIMLASTHSDCAILNSGTLRSDRIHPKGDFKLRDLVTIM